LLISMGISVQVARLFTRFKPRAMWLTRLTVGGLAVALLIGSVAVRGLPLLAESRARAATAGSADMPNVLLIILDTVRAANMGMYGYVRGNTPTLSRLASEGVRFDRAIAPASWTLPTHASVFSGLDPKAVAAGWKRSMDDSHLTLAEVLAPRGYVSAGFAANPQYTTWETGLTQGFHRWEDFESSAREAFWASSLSQTFLVREIVKARTWGGRWRALRSLDLKVPGDPHHVRRPAADIVDRFLDWQGSLGPKPFFGFLNLYDAHDPYVEPPGWTPMYTPRTSGIDTYDSSIAYMDQQLGRLVDSLRVRGALAQTILIVTSDHGEQFGEHELMLHGNSLYMNSIHVPLLIRAPQRTPSGAIVDQPVDLSSLPATILDLANVSQHALPGRSLRATWEHSLPADSALAVSWIEQHPWGKVGEPATAGPVTSLVDATHHWILHSNDLVELYEYHSDSLELNDLGADSSTVSIREAFKAWARAFRMP
jgi:arylsulfatase A-like enzyme